MIQHNDEDDEEIESELVVVVSGIHHQYDVHEEQVITSKQQKKYKYKSRA